MDSNREHISGCLGMGEVREGGLTQRGKRKLSEMMGLFIILTVVMIHTVSKLTKPNILNIGSLLPVDYISIKLGEGERGEGVGEREGEATPARSSVSQEARNTRVCTHTHTYRTLSTKLPFGL